MNIAALLERTARRAGANSAVAPGRRPAWDYAALARHSFGLAHGLVHRLGLRRGDRIAIFMRNRPEYLQVLYAAWTAGCCVVPINAKLHPKEVGVILADSGASVLFSDRAALADLTPALPAAPRAIAADDAEFKQLTHSELLAPVHAEGDELAWLFYTSGTTGRPKGVMLTHRNLLAMTLGYANDVDPVTPADRILYAAPISHGAGMYNFVHVLAGACHVFPESGSFDAAECFDLAGAHGRTSGFVAPTMVNRLVEHAEKTGADPGDFKTLVYGGGPMYVADILRALDVMGPRFVQIYGQGECPMAITALSRADLAAREHPRHAARIASVGTAQSAVQLRIVSADGTDLRAGECGEIMVRGEPVMRGYWNDPSATAAALGSGWLATGDMGALDAEGYLTLIDRSKDVVISGGSNIYPREVEEVLLRHPAVQEACVVGRADPDWGEEVVAVVALRAGCTVDAAELDRLCLAEIARFKRPKAYSFTAELPKNNYGKILKREVRARIARDDAGLVRI